MSGEVRESFLERNWAWMLIAFGIVLTSFFALYNPIVPGEPRTSHTEPKVMGDQPKTVVRSGGE